MKRLLLLLVLLPSLVYSQYQTKDFTPSKDCELIGKRLNINLSKNSTIELNIPHNVSRLYISGKACLSNEEESFVRVILRDKDNIEYLVYENYPILSDELSSSFSKVALESQLLNNITPESIIIELNHAAMSIDSVFYSKALDFKQEYTTMSKALRHIQTQHIADVINKHIKERHMTWIAGSNSMAMKTFEEKKKMFGNKVPCLFGFDYYKGGLYIMNPLPTDSCELVRPSTRSNSFVRDFDWRKRHGKNWITSVKQQSGNTCWAFATTATIESNFNIYYNQVFPDNDNNNLSEQELVSCLDNDGRTMYQRYNDGGYVMYALDYIQRMGIVREECFPFAGLSSCDNKCVNPVEQVSFSSFRNLYHNSPFNNQYYTYSNEIADTLRKAILKSPVVVDYKKAGEHSISCVGFHQIQMGDTICSNINNSYFFVVDSTTAHFVDMVSWIIKNSWGADWGENGFAKVSFYTVQLRLYEIIPPFTSLLYSDDDIVVEDTDGDGYFNWGTGPRPNDRLPAWAEQEEDGDDSDWRKGAMDEYGFLADLSYTQPVFVVDHDMTDAELADSLGSRFLRRSIRINSGVTLTIQGDICFYRINKIYMNANSILKIDGGTLVDATLYKSGNNASVKIINGGKIQSNKKPEFILPHGISLDMDEGEIQ